MDDRLFSNRPKLRRWFRILLAIVLVVAGLGGSAHRFGPRIRNEISYRLALRDLESDRLDDAEVQLDGLIAGQPRETRARLALVQVYRRQGRITEAEETLQRAVELGLPIEQARPEHELLRSSVSTIARSR